MNFMRVSTDEQVAAIVLNRPKVNAINEAVIEELTLCFQELERDSNVKAVVLTGEGSFFSFGLDIPELLSYTKDSFQKFVFKFTDLLRYVFLFPKPVIAALNGHAIAGGCMLALACDYRLMLSEKAKISLNELTFGSTLFTSGVEMLKFAVGTRNTGLMLYTGTMYSADEAKGLGLIDEMVSKENLHAAAQSRAKEFASKDSRAFQSIKMLLKKQAAGEIEKNERASVIEFVDIWYSESTWKNLEKIKIRD